MGFKVIFVGDEPSSKNKNPDIAFIGTQSYKRIVEWMDELDIEDFMMVNRTSPLFIQKVMFAKSEGYDVIALGMKAHTDLQNIGIGHFVLPHPSGRNRMLNNKEALKATLNLCKSYLG